MAGWSEYSVSDTSAIMSLSFTPTGNRTITVTCSGGRVVNGTRQDVYSPLNF